MHKGVSSYSTAVARAAQMIEPGSHVLRSTNSTGRNRQHFYILWFGGGGEILTKEKLNISDVQ